MAAELEKEKDDGAVATAEPADVSTSPSAADGQQPGAEEDESKGDDAWGAYWRVFGYAGTFEYTLQGIAVVAAIASGVGIASQNLIFGEFITVIVKYATGESSPHDFRQDAAHLALYFVYLGIGRFFLSYLYNCLLTYAGYRVTRNLRHAYFRAALRQEIAFFDKGDGGSIATQGMTNGRHVQGGISEKFGLTFQGLSTFVAAFAIAFATHWKLTLICLCVAPAIILVMAVAAGMAAGHESSMMKTYGQANSFAEGVLASARTVHAFEIRSRLVAKFDEYLVNAHRTGNKLAPIMGTLFSAEYTIIYLGFGLAFWQGINMLARGDIQTPGDIFVVLLSVVIGSMNLTILAPYAIDFSRSATAAVQLFKLIDRAPSIDAFDPTGEQPSETVGHIELKNITFAYPTRPGTNVLEDFTLNIPAGKVTALVGQSGSGKSTIVGLIERWYNPNSGSIKLDGRPIDKLNLNWLRRHVRLVQQEPVLFQGSVFDNIAHGLVGTPWERASREEQMVHVQEAAKIAFAHDFVSELPEGYDTEIGQRGGLLSGGQKQRIAIARSVVSQPKVLLLDEATSALDPHAEGIVQQALDKASEGRTTIVIAHKLATIRKADNIVVMTKGRIVEQGTHEGLIAEGGVYARLVKIQDLTVASRGASSDSEGDDTIAEEDPAHPTKTITKYPTADQNRLKAMVEHDNFDNYKHQGFIRVIARLIRENPDLAWPYIISLIACIAAAAAFPGQAILFAKINEVFALQGRAMVDRGNFFALMFVVLAIGLFITYFALGWATTLIAHTLSHKYRRQIFNDTLRQDLKFFDRQENSTGALASRVDAHPQAIFELMGINVGLVLISVVNILACSILGIVYSWNLGLVVVFAGLPPLVGCGYLKVRIDAKLDQAVTDRLSQSATIASEAITAIRTVSSLAIEEHVLDKYTQELDHAVSHSVRPLITMMVWFALTQSIEYWFQALGFWYGCRLVSFGDIDIVAFFITFMGVFFSGQAAGQFFMYSSSMTKGKNAANYVFWLAQLQPTIQQTDTNRDNAPASGGPIELDNIRFSYPLRPDTVVLRGVDLTINKGQFVAVVGASGCGKSTIVALLERFYDPSTGTIRIDSAALTDLNPRLYRSIVSLVQQEPTLFQGTIRENIALGIDLESPSSEGEVSASVPDSKIEAALRAANAWDFVSSLPEGMGTFAGPNGTQLSGGQRQRIAIARALVRKPKILLLDEATSALDTESEKIVQSSLAEAAREGDRITIAVAHRLSTIRDADLICVFHGGRIVESGTHAELAGNGGLYRKMVEAQSLD